MAALTDEQTMLRDAAHDWAQERNPVLALRNLRDDGAGKGFDPEKWRQIADLGWTGIVIPEAFGGADFGHHSFGLVLEELGRTLTASPLLISAAASNAVSLGGARPLKKRWLEAVADGSAIGALALDESPRHDPYRIASAVEAGRLTGRKLFVYEGMSADFLVVSAHMGGSIELFAIPADARGVQREPVVMMDSRDAAHIAFDNVEIESDWKLEGGSGLLDMILDRARIYVSAEMLGIAQQAFETTVEYLKIREQYGQPIGAFQALQHRAAKMFTDLQLTRSAVESALDAIDQNSRQLAELASLAKAKASETLNLVSCEMVQMHGGIGMTDAHDAGLYLKRARVTEAMFGNAAFHRDRYARLLGY